MNRIYLSVVIIAIVLVSCNIRTKDRLANDASKQYELFLRDTTTVQVIDSSYNFGKVTDGDKVEYNYRFKNTGTKPLVIINTTASCGCTIPQKPERPIAAGDTGVIKVVFDSKGRVGTAHKTITVVANARPVFPDLLLTGEVVGKQ
ncbi:MAG: DUF1573 domain-containing protein [Sphingobacteriales bacterium]|nr:DUF1573 domain-containing protein [Sphingobacteriales bacterium]